MDVVPGKEVPFQGHDDSAGEVFAAENCSNTGVPLYKLPLIVVIAP